ncbi:MAG TPA: hypothetical protein VEJ37_01700 [Xanthobacteraceae bacterium]|nr:hypothetical protein [Xanthobacteraceae bacterium]
MTDIAARTAEKTGDHREAYESANQRIARDLRYGRIGISAVAAAARYQRAAKNQAYAPVVIKSDGHRTATA